MSIKVSVVVTTFNRFSDLKRCLESVLKSDFKGYELVVVDDASSDETAGLSEAGLRALIGAGPELPIKVIHNPENFRMVKARNTGARNSAGEYVLFIDDDNIIDPGMISALVAFGDANPTCGVLGPSMHYWSNRRKYLDYQKINLFTGKTSGHIDATPAPACDSDGVPNVFMIRAKVFQEAGYFDEALMQTFTEPDFSYNAAKHGYRSVIVKAAITYHDIPYEFSPRTLGGEFKSKAYCTIRNRALMVGRYGRWYHKLTYGLLFSWAWAFIYSALVARYWRFDLVRLYWYGWRDGQRYLLTGRLVNALPSIL
jgi:glycosyltransferase involved in cell wall biosynthesis